MTFHGSSGVPSSRRRAALASGPRIPDAESILAWRRGEVVLDETPLAEAVAEMNHHDKLSIVIDTPAIATHRVSGLYHTGDNEDFARAVAKLYRLELYERDGRIHLRSP